jgi:large subunit ribosomal protein L29
MNYAEISGLTDKDLVKKTKELRAQLFQARMKNALGQLANPMTIRTIRKDIARLQTALRSKINAGSKG